jgi:hypothetical protein
VSKLPRRIAQWVGKVLAFCVVLCAFATIGALSTQTITSTYASSQANTLDIPTVPVPTISVPIPTLPPDPLDTPTPEATPTHAATPTPKPVHTATPVATPTDESSSEPTPVPTSTDESSSGSTPAQTPTAVPTPTAKVRPTTQPTSASAVGIQPTPPVQTATPATNQLTPTVQPTSSIPTPDVTSTTSTASIATPTTSSKSATPTTQHDQGTLTALIITSGLGMTTLLTAGTLMGVQARKKRKQAEALALDQTAWPAQSGMEGAAYQISSPHLMDQNLMMSPGMQEILQQSPAQFMASEAAGLLQTDTPELINIPTMELQAQHSMLNEQASITEYPTEELLATNEQNDRDSISEYHTEPRIISVQNDTELISWYHTEPMMTSVHNTSGSPNEYHTEPGVNSIQKKGITHRMSLPQDIRTDPTLNAMKKQAQMGIFVLLDQEKNSSQSSTLEEKETEKASSED